MKLLVTFLVGLLTAGFVVPTFACTPPRTKYGHQARVLSELFSQDHDVSSRVSQLAGTNDKVSSIKIVRNKFKITLTNGCLFFAETKWTEPTFPGECPAISGFEITGEACP
jgi:hypothetical protein